MSNCQGLGDLLCSTVGEEAEETVVSCFPLPERVEGFLGVPHTTPPSTSCFAELIAFASLGSVAWAPAAILHYHHSPQAPQEPHAPLCALLTPAPTGFVWDWHGEGWMSVCVLVDSWPLSSGLEPQGKEAGSQSGWPWHSFKPPLIASANGTMGMAIVGHQKICDKA